MVFIIPVIRSNTRKQILEGFAGHQIAVGQSGFAKFGQQRIARRVGFNPWPRDKLDPLVLPVKIHPRLFFSRIPCGLA